MRWDTRWLGLLLFLMVFICSVVVCQRQENNIFAAIEHMKPLMDLEIAVTSNAVYYLQQQRKLLEDLRPLKEEIEEAQKLFASDPDYYLRNPIDSFKLIKRLGDGWQDVPRLLNNGTSEDKGVRGNIRDWLDVYHMYTPSQRDISGAIEAFVRLQDTYNITAREFADGKIGHMLDSKLPLTAEDCVAITNWAHSSGRYVRMKQWIHEAERLIFDPSIPHRHGETTQQSVINYLAWTYYLEGDVKTTLKYTELALQNEPDNAYHLANREVYNYYIKHNLPMEYEETKYMANAQRLLDLSENNGYVKACRGINMEPRGYLNESNMRSYYKHDNPLLYLKPLKVTQVHDNPPVWILHDIVSPSNIKKLRDLAAPRLDVSKVVSKENDKLINAEYRVSKNMFLVPGYAEDDAVQKPMIPMFEAITGLNFQFAETLQMNNYGLGGQYEFHHDYGEPGSLVARDPTGNRIATLLLYLSDVERGGHTVFTEIGLTVPPMKGSGVFWYNLHKNGTGWFNTRHASCPVVSGSKWVANKWIRMGGNEFLRPCSLKRDE